eukprot:GEMP01088852.1.p2 GENE.GEMP01088852.1~~GEMP01088852.1.p2  ORF type:complete len:153 (+),score=19.17 GEMP01088852.1:180-638(+)
MCQEKGDNTKTVAKSSRDPAEYCIPRRSERAHKSVRQRLEATCEYSITGYWEETAMFFALFQRGATGQKNIACGFGAWAAFHFLLSVKVFDSWETILRVCAERVCVRLSHLCSSPFGATVGNLTCVSNDCAKREAKYGRRLIYVGGRHNKCV